MLEDNSRLERGFTIVELLITIIVTGIMISSLLVITFTFFGNTIRNSNEARLAVESQNIMRSIVEELRVAAGIKSSNANPDPNGPSGGWSTSNASLILIITTPALDSNNNFIYDSSTGDRYNNEIVYFSQNGSLYKRYLVPSGSVAAGNRYKTSCPTLSSTCAKDVLLSTHFQSLNFTFYDAGNNVTSTLADARSVKLNISMQEKAYGQTVSYNNSIRMILRNYML